MPHLAQKIDLLLLHHEAVRTRTRLAAHLGIHPSNISLWQNGDGGLDKRDHMPRKHLAAICNIFDIEEPWLVLENVDHFAALLIQNARRLSPWHELLERREQGEALVMLPAGSDATRTRLLYKAQLEAIRERVFAQFESTYIALDLTKSEPPVQAFPQYLTLIDVGRDYRCLCPSPYLAEPLPQVTGPKVTIPLGAPVEYLIANETGSHYLAAILTSQPLSRRVEADLRRTQPMDLKPTLDVIAKSLLQGPASSWRLWFYDYVVLARMPGKPAARV